jgi:ketosteroid isomerase-like protein
VSNNGNVKVVQQAYQDFQAGNIQGVLSQMASDVEWQLPAIANVPISGLRRGSGQVAEFFSTLAEDQEPVVFEPREFISQGDNVVALGHYKWNVKKTGRQFESDFVHVFTVRDGRIARFREYMDSAAVAAGYTK